MRGAEDARQQPHVFSARIEPEDKSRPSITEAPQGGLAAADTGDGESCSPTAFAPETEESVAALEASLCKGDYESTQQRAMAENLARREADRELISALARVGFTGPTQEMFEAELAAYAYPVMMAWTRTGEIIKRCKQKGRPLGICDTGAGWSRDDRCELSTETVARALVFFRKKVLLAGVWDHTRGATIKTYFVGACLFQFPNVYQRWNTERRSWQDRCAVVVDDPEDPAGLRQLGSDDNTEEHAIARHQLQQVMTELKDSYPELRQVVQLQLLGDTCAEAGARLGLSARAIEGQWYRFRKQRRSNDEEGRLR